jgi:hypothetical protein
MSIIWSRATCISLMARIVMTMGSCAWCSLLFMRHYSERVEGHHPDNPRYNITIMSAMDSSKAAAKRTRRSATPRFPWPSPEIRTKRVVLSQIFDRSYSVPSLFSNCPVGSPCGLTDAYHHKMALDVLMITFDRTSS